MLRSPPSRRRGLKLKKGQIFFGNKVASFAEAWIEIETICIIMFSRFYVASFAEAWIEIQSWHCVRMA